MISYTWEITSKKTINENNYSNVISQVYWTKIGTNEEGKTGKFSGCTPLTLEHNAPGDVTEFIEFENVSDALIISWISDFIIASGLSETIDISIENQINNIDQPEWR